MRGSKNASWITLLTGYYGILQTFHFLFLARGGLILARTGKIPFPASPPPGGWSAEIIPVLIGMAAVDVVAASLGIYFSYSLLLKNRIKYLAGLISLTIALTSAIIYLFGTLPSGAWSENPISYLIVIAVFSPIIPLYAGLIRQTSKFIMDRYSS